MEHWADDSMDEVLPYVPSPDHWGMDDDAFKEYISDFQEEIFGGKAVKMNFKDLFKLTPVREKHIQKFETKQFYYVVSLCPLLE